VALHLAASAPHLVHRLLLVNSAGLPLHAPPVLLAARSMRSFLQSGNGSYPPEVLRDHLLTPPRILWQSAQEIIGSDLRAEMTSMSAPTQIIWGARDLLLPLALGYQLHAALPHATFVTMPDCGHCPMLAQPVLFSQIALRFLQKDGSIPSQS